MSHEILHFNPYKFDNHNCNADPEIQLSVSHTLENCTEVSNIVPTGVNELSVISCNIDGFKSNFDEFVTRYNILSPPVRSAQPSVFTFCETNISLDENTSMYHMPGYTGFHSRNTTGKVKGSGISMYLKNDIDFSPYQPFIMNGRALQSYGGTVKLSNGQTLNLICLYRYHIGTDWESWFAEIETLLKKACTTKVIITGDFNMNLFRLDNSSNVRRYFDLFSSFGLVPMIGRATNFTHNASTLIDQTWTNIVSHGCSSHLVTTLSVSSHIPTMCVFPDPYLISESGPITITSTDFNLTSLTNFKNDYDILCRNHVISLNASDSSVDLAHSFSSYYNQLSLLYNKHFVKHKTLTNRRNNHTKPWVSPSLARSIHVKSILYKKWVASRGSSRESMAASDYRTYRAILRGLLVKSRDDYFTSKFLKCDNDIKKCWSVINSLRGNNKKAIYPSCVKIDSGIVTDPRAISNELNKYFTSVASDLNKSKFGVSQPDFHKFSRFMPNRVGSSLFLSPVSSDEISIIIKGLKPKKSGDFSSLCLKHLNFLFSTDFSIIINKCMAAGVFPSELKQASIHPLHKGGDTNKLSNYRPISLLPILSKVFEKCLHKRVIEFLDIHSVISKSQFGFLKGRSTTQALHEGVGSAVKSLDSKRFSLGLFLDLSKAFDTLHHDILLAKLEHYGIRGIVLQLFKSFLSGRSQSVRVGNTTSDPLPVSCGVPQGSTLGPLLFLLYINDIVNLPSGSDSCSIRFILFADDTSIFVSGRSAPEVQWIIDKLMSLLKQYFDANFLHVNTSKTKFMHFSSPQSPYFPSQFIFCYDGTMIEQVKQFKFLGIEISDSLTWEAHIKSVSTKLHRNLGSIYRLRKSLPNQLKIPVYYALFQSHINYGISVWGSGGCMNKLEPIFKAQKNALRCLFSLTKVPGSFGKPGTKSTFNNLNILTVHHLYHMAVLFEVHRAKLNDDNSIDFSIRKPNLAIIPGGNYKYLDVNFSFEGPRIWNLYSPDNTFINSHTFKKQVRTRLLKVQGSGDPLHWDDCNTNLQNIKQFKMKSTN